MFRDRTVFEALLDDFTACLLHSSHGTLGSIKTRQTTDTSTYFPLLNPLILVQSRMLREIQPSSIPIYISPPSCHGTSLGKAGLSPYKPSAPSPGLPPRAGIYHQGPQNHRAVLAPASAGPFGLLPCVPRTRPSAGWSPRVLDRACASAEPCTEPLAPALPCARAEAAASAAHPGSPVPPAGITGTTSHGEHRDLGLREHVVPPASSGHPLPYSHIRSLPESLAGDSRAAGGCHALGETMHPQRFFNDPTLRLSYVRIVLVLFPHLMALGGCSTLPTLLKAPGPPGGWVG